MKCLFPVEKPKTVKGTRIYTAHRCGQCMPCRITRKQEKTLRIILESKLYEYNSFVTLTYDDNNRRSDRSLCKAELQKFIKRLRKNSGYKFRYFAVGEYGEKSATRNDVGREHYHIILFGYPYVYPEFIERSWPFGFTTTDPLLAGGAGYIAGYTTKKLTAPDSVPGKEPEFSLSSRGKKSDKDPRFRGGIGYGYCQQIIKNMTRDKLNFVGEDYKYIRVDGMLLPLDKYMQKAINKHIGYSPIDKTLGQQLTISMRVYKNMSYPEAENDAKKRSEIKARQKLRIQKRRKKI
jgi:hypothetical protein